MEKKCNKTTCVIHEQCTHKAVYPDGCANYLPMEKKQQPNNSQKHEKLAYNRPQSDGEKCHYTSIEYCCISNGCERTSLEECEDYIPANASQVAEQPIDERFKDCNINPEFRDVFEQQPEAITDDKCIWCKEYLEHSQPVSDEEIEKEALKRYPEIIREDSMSGEYDSNSHQRIIFIKCAKWMRDKLTNKQQP